MIKDNNGQVALEYLLIFTISLILLIVFTLPLVDMTIENTFDVTDTINVKADLDKITQAIKQVYGEGQGAKQTVNINLKDSIKINFDSNTISTNLKLAAGSYKFIKLNYNSNLPKSSISLNKGTNTLIVEWPVDSSNMKIYKK